MVVPPSPFPLPRPSGSPPGTAGTRACKSGSVMPSAALRGARVTRMDRQHPERPGGHPLPAGIAQLAGSANACSARSLASSQRPAWARQWACSTWGHAQERVPPLTAHCRHAVLGGLLASGSCPASSIERAGTPCDHASWPVVPARRAAAADSVRNSAASRRRPRSAWFIPRMARIPGCSSSRPANPPFLPRNHADFHRIRK